MWDVLEPIITVATVYVSLYIFFKDPIRRWKFFAYNPTLIIILKDPIKNKIGLIHDEYGWHFIQSGIYDADIYTTVEQILFREIGIDSNCFSLKSIKELGTVTIKDKSRIKKVYLGGIRLSNHSVGKGYLACLIHCDSTKIIKNSKLGYGLTDIKFMQMSKAMKLLKEANNGKENKMNIIKKALLDI